MYRSLYVYDQLFGLHSSECIAPDFDEFSFIYGSHAIHYPHLKNAFHKVSRRKVFSDIKYKLGSGSIVDTNCQLFVSYMGSGEWMHLRYEKGD